MKLRISLFLLLASFFLIANKSLEAQWSPRSVTISFDANGGSGDVPEPQTYTYGTSGTLPGQGSLSRTGYTFGGWTSSSTATIALPNTSSTAFGFVDASNDVEQTVYALWVLEVYSISYSLGGGSASNPSSYTIETASFTLNNPSRSGYTFTGWSGTGLSGSSNKSVTITQGSTGARSYTAYWSQNVVPTPTPPSPVTLSVNVSSSGMLYKVRAYGPNGYTDFTSSSVTCYPGYKVVFYGRINSSINTVEWRFKGMSGSLQLLGTGSSTYTTIPSNASGSASLYYSANTTGYIMFYSEMSSGWAQRCSIALGS